MLRRTLLHVSILGCLAAACGSQPDAAQSDSSQLDIIVGGQSSLSYYNQDDRISRSIGRMGGRCTATHIGNGYVLTAGHCVKGWSCSGSSFDVTWGYTDRNRSGNGTGRCVSVVDWQLDDNYDYAILEYVGTPRDYLPVNLSYRPAAGDQLSIYSHPSGVPLANSGDCQVLGAFSWQTQFAHSCDTLGGSSGAAVLNEYGEVIGAHVFGIESADLNGATYLVDIQTLYQIDLGYRTR